MERGWSQCEGRYERGEIVKSGPRRDESSEFETLVKKSEGEKRGRGEGRRGGRERRAEGGGW